MRTRINAFNVLIIALLFGVCASCNTQPQNVKEPEVVVEETDPLPSWNDGEVKQAIIGYVEDVTDSQSANFIPVLDRIATFDNDGALWSEQIFFSRSLISCHQSNVPT